MEWRQFVMNLESIDPDRVETVLVENGAQSVTLTDAGDDPVLEPAPGETPLWTDTKLTALFTADADFDVIRHELRTSLEVDELPPNRIENLADRVWERAWISRFGPMEFGRRLWVIPGDAEVPVDDAIVVRLDPGLAFGTGTHETTALCLEWLESIDVTGRSVFDFGCGSGILSVAALKLGAAEAVAVDIDLQAVTATRQNAERNFVDDRLQVGNAIELHLRQFDIVVANILARTLIDKANLICSLLRPGGQLALSGILASQVDEVQEAYSELVGFGPVAMRNDWVRLSGTRSTD